MCQHSHSYVIAARSTCRWPRSGACSISSPHPEADCGDINRLIDEQLARVRARLNSLHALEKQIAALRARCKIGHVAADCGILHELVAAAHGEACACHAAKRVEAQ